LSAISAIAENPDRIKNIFVNGDQINQNGCYTMRLCINGQFKNVTVDDQFPYDQVQKKPAFSKSKENELWVLLLEKAWAKVNSCYENTITGYASEAFRFLTGAPVEFYNHEYIEDLWPKLLEYNELKYIICASAGKPNLTAIDYQKLGLVSDHAYAVI
jgi:hypothetical protein